MALKGMVPPDPQTGVSQVRFAVIFTPRPSRYRLPASVHQYLAIEPSVPMSWLPSSICSAVCSV